jgi:hypothetical protein
MNKIILSLVLTLSLVLGFSSIKASEVINRNPVTIETSNLDTYIYIRVYENGSFWIYVFTEDGIFVSKHIDG